MCVLFCVCNFRFCCIDLFSFFFFFFLISVYFFLGSVGSIWFFFFQIYTLIFPVETVSYFIMLWQQFIARKNLRGISYCYFKSWYILSTISALNIKYLHRSKNSLVVSHTHRERDTFCDFNSSIPLPTTTTKIAIFLLGKEIKENERFFYLISLKLKLFKYVRQTIKPFIKGKCDRTYHIECKHPKARTKNI